MAMVSPRGYCVELVEIQRSLSRPPRPRLRVASRGYWIADCAMDVADVRNALAITYKYTSRFDEKLNHAGDLVQRGTHLPGIRRDHDDLGALHTVLVQARTPQVRSQRRLSVPARHRDDPPVTDYLPHGHKQPAHDVPLPRSQPERPTRLSHASRSGTRGRTRPPGAAPSAAARTGSSGGR
jgi:hypothetical protein